jgi:hypothetical protein
MSLCNKVEILWTNTGKGTSVSTRPVAADVNEITDLAVSDDDPEIITFSWSVNKYSTQYAGTLVFQFSFTCYADDEDKTLEFSWHTDQYSFVSVRPSLHVSDIINDAYPNVISELLQRADQLRLEWDDVDEQNAEMYERIAEAVRKVEGLSAADVGAVPTTRTVNKKALSNDISLNAADVGSAAFYANLSDLGLSPDTVTPLDLFNKMPDCSIGLFSVGTDWNTEAVPASYGTLFVTRRATSRGFFIFRQIGGTHQTWTASLNTTNGVAFSGWVRVYDTLNKPSPVDINAAPAGYVEEHKVASAAGDMDNFLVAIFDSMRDRTKKVVYMSHNVDESNTIGVPGGNWYFVLYKFASDYGVIEGVRYDFSANNPPLKIMKNRAYGNWGDWMWVNPPMNADVEYRTTERWQGKPVYTKLIDLNTLPNNSTAYIYNVLPNNTKILSVYGYAIHNNDGSTHGLTPFLSDYWSLPTNTYFGFKTNCDATVYHGYAIIKYVIE